MHSLLRYHARLALRASLGCWLSVVALAAFGQGPDERVLVPIDWQNVAGVQAIGEELPQPNFTQNQFPLNALPPEMAVCDGPCSSVFDYHLGGKGRAYYINDQRIEFTGLEATFAVEGVVDGGVRQTVGSWDLIAETEIFLNQPFDRNILADNPQRRSLLSNFDIEPLQISQLYVGARRGDWYASFGRFVTPFGRFYFPNYRNEFDDSPFIRSDAIKFRETGMLFQWDPEGWVFTTALTNGGWERDTNSSKALVARAGIDLPYFALGSSIKLQDGIGSEGQKTYNEHFGLDAMVRFGSWTLSGEVIYDHHGLRRPGIAPVDIFWGRSLYFRDVNKAFHEPISGVGYYVNLGYEGPSWSLHFNYGDYFPEDIGVPDHDQPVHRGLIKASRFWTPNFETYGIVLVENDRRDSFISYPRQGLDIIFGCQVSL